MLTVILTVTSDTTDIEYYKNAVGNNAAFRIVSTLTPARDAESPAIIEQYNKIIEESDSSSDILLLSDQVDLHGDFNEFIANMQDCLYVAEKHALVYAQEIENRESLIKTAKRYLPRYSVNIDEGAFCVLIKRDVLKLLGLFNTEYRSIEYALMDFYYSINQYGFSAITAHHSLYSFNDRKSKHENSADKEMFTAKFPYSSNNEVRYAQYNTNQFIKFLRVMDEDYYQKKRILFDCRIMPASHCGTSEYQISLYNAFYSLFKDKYDIFMLVTHEADEYHRLSDKFENIIYPDTVEGTFHLGLAPNQLMFFDSQLPMNNNCLKIVQTMYDIIIHRVDEHLSNENMVRAKDVEFGIMLSDGIVFISDYTKNDFMARFADVERLQDKHFKVIYPATGFNMPKRNDYVLPFNDYFLIVGNNFKHKAIADTIETIRNLEHNFIILGGDTIYNSPTIYCYKSGHLEEDLLSYIFANCKAIIFPSLYEGFGFPLVMGFRYSKRVLIKNNDLNRELLNNFHKFKSYFHYFDHFEDINELLNSINFTGELESVSYEDSWERAAIEYEAFFSEIINTPLDFNDLYERNRLFSRFEVLLAEKNQLDSEIRQRDFVIERRDSELAKLDSEIEEKQRENEILQIQYQAIQNSFWWKITKPARVLTKGLKWLLKSFPPTRILYKGLYKLRHGVDFDVPDPPVYNASIFDAIDDTPYDSEYQHNIDFSSHSAPVKALTFYLPQFHQIPENDEWWGKKFTEWANTRTAEPRYDKHYQPRIPHYDIGYYRLDSIDTIKKQVKLAKEHGIYGFCFYYYWFSGKSLLDKPLELLIENPEVDINFCLCWANENWTRTWDGQKDNILMKQEYTDSDGVKFIDDIKRYIHDDRYIRSDGKPIILVYNILEIPSPEKVFDTWRKRAREAGIGEILIWACEVFGFDGDNEDVASCIDATVEFPPHNVPVHDLLINDIKHDAQSAGIFNYKKVVNYSTNKIKELLQNKQSVDRYSSVMLGWDNAARRNEGFSSYYGFSLETFYEWCSSVVDYTTSSFGSDARFMFVNAWNEWAEGTYLEPDEKYGYASINTFSKAIFGLPLSYDLALITESSIKTHNISNLDTEPMVAVHIHLFWLDLIPEVIEHLENMPIEFDCFVSTDSESKKQIISDKLEALRNAKTITISVFENRGRNIAPFLMQMKEYINSYDYICHIHTKKTNTGEHGDLWRKYLYRNLLGSPEVITNIIGLFENNHDVGIMFPETFPTLLPFIDWAGNESICTRIMADLGSCEDLPKKPIFPAGSMFWARTEAIQPLFEYGLSSSDFPIESDQVYGTLAHAVERIWVYVAKLQGYKHLVLLNTLIPAPAKLHTPKKKRIALFAHYNSDETVSENDMFLLRSIKTVAEHVVFISNSRIEPHSMAAIKSIADDILIRKNKGMDFGAWKAGILKVTFNKLNEYDQLILVNNSIVGPVYDLSGIMNHMDGRDLDFWGITLFPECEDKNYIAKTGMSLTRIPEHIQSYFHVYEKPVFSSKVFQGIWKNMPYYTGNAEVVENIESKLTEQLAGCGFNYDVYIRESKHLAEYFSMVNVLGLDVLYMHPYSAIIAGAPFIKKKITQYISTIEMVQVNRLITQLGIDIDTFCINSCQQAAQNSTSARGIIGADGHRDTSINNTHVQIERKSNSIFEHFINQTDEEFLELLIRADTEPVIDGVQMPGFPDIEFQRKSVGGQGPEDLRYGPYEFTSTVKKYAKKLSIAFDDNTKLLDFGVGWGRMIRFFFKDLPSDNLFGIDTWQIMIDKCNQLLPSGNYTLNNPLPPTDFEDNTFDIIMSFSVFSHLRSDAAEMWIKEFARILKPNGIIVATTEGVFFLDLLEKLKKDRTLAESNEWYANLLHGFSERMSKYRKLYNNGEYIYAPTGGGDAGDALDSSFYGDAIVPEKYIRDIFGKHLTFIDFLDNQNMGQAVFVMQKK